MHDHPDSPAVSATAARAGAGPAGFFISFEGGEGSGKSTQIRLLTERLEAAGRAVLPVREPGGTAIGEVIRHLLKFHPDNGDMTPETELLLFAASRAQLVRETLLPALAEGKIVVADRFIDSTTVYQGGGRGLPAEFVRSLNVFAAGACLPHVTFLLDLDAERGLERARRRAPETMDRLEREPAAFYETVRRAYLALAAAEPERFVVVDASQPPETVHTLIVETLARRHRGLFS